VSVATQIEESCGVPDDVANSAPDLQEHASTRPLPAVWDGRRLRPENDCTGADAACCAPMKARD